MASIANKNTEINEKVICKYYERNRRDLEDLNLLQTQKEAQLILIFGYILEFKASNQAIDIVLARLRKRQLDFYNGTYNDEDEQRIEEEEAVWKNAGVDADKTALLAAELELFGQTIITYLAQIKLSRYKQNTQERDYLLSKTANEEIFTGAVLEELAYMFNLQGARILYNTSNENPIAD